MSAELRVEIERCLSGELRMEFDEEGRLVRAAACTGVFAFDAVKGTAHVSNQYGSSSWSDGISRGEWSFGTWEQSTETPCSLEVFVGSALEILRGELMGSVKSEVAEACRAWFAYGSEHGLPVEAMDSAMLEFYVSTISYQRPEELLALARQVDKMRQPHVWAAIVRRIEVFSARQQRQLKQELGLAPPKKGPAKPKPPSPG